VQLDFGGGQLMSGPVDAGGSFEISRPLTTGQGTETLRGSFIADGGVPVVLGTATIAISGGPTCELEFSAQKR
jgi:hypothetical protein